MTRAIIPVAMAVILAVVAPSNDAHNPSDYTNSFHYTCPLPDLKFEEAHLNTAAYNPERKKAIDDLAMNIYSEGSVCPHDEKIAIAYSVINRLNHPTRYGNTLEEVLDPKMYNGMKARKFLQREIEADSTARKIYNECRQIAEEVLSGRLSNPKATHYYNPGKVNPPNWNWSLMKEIKVKGSIHKFYKEL